MDFKDEMSKVKAFVPIQSGGRVIFRKTTRAKVIFRNEATVNQFYIDTHAEGKIPKLKE